MNRFRIGWCLGWLFGRGRKGAFLAASLLMLVLSVRPACAVPLSDLLSGGFLDVAEARFTDWGVVSLDATATAPNLSLVQVNPLATDPLNPGLQFASTSQLAIAGVNALDMVLRFRVQAIGGGNAFLGHSLTIGGLSFGGAGGIAYISDELVTGLGIDLGPAVAIADNETETFQFADTSDFAPQAGLFVTTNVFLTGLAATDTINLTSFTQRFFQTGPEILRGDYNQNGRVDAADYVVWRNNVGALAGTLPNDILGTTIGTGQYNTWRANFGLAGGAGATEFQHSAVPEPCSLVLLVAGWVLGSPRRAAGADPTRFRVRAGFVG